MTPVIEQALYGTARLGHGEETGGYRFLGRSPGFADEWLPEAERLCTGFGERPAGVSCPECVFARPFASRQVAIVQVADQGRDDAGRPGALGFRLLILPKSLYEDLGGDPFWIAERLPAPWAARGTLPVLEWTAGPPPRRTVAELHRVLDVPHSATLLGGVQALLDGHSLVFERREPAPGLVRALWALLPASSRAGLWPASFCFANTHRFHVVVVPRRHDDSPEFAGYLSEEQAGDYPEGRYELALQTAVESGDQQALDQLLSRRSREQVLRLAAGLLAVFVVVLLLFRFLVGPLEPPRQPQPSRPAGSAPVVRPAPETPKPAPNIEKPQQPVQSETFDLPAGEHYPALPPEERRMLAQGLRDLARRYGIELPATRGDSAAAITVLLEAFDARLGTPNPRRDPARGTAELQAARTAGWLASPLAQAPLLASAALGVGTTGQLRDQGPVQRQLRVLLWKHGVRDYDARLSPLELLERLEERLREKGSLRPDR